MVDSTNGNGLGIRNLKPTGSAQGVSAVYMRTSATPSASNPNPASGYIVIQLSDKYYGYLGGFSGQVSPPGTSVTSTTANLPMMITSLGTATLAQWQAVGLPLGITPSVGLAFVPTSSASIGGSATVAPVKSTGSGIDHMEVVGDANQTINQSFNGSGGQIIVACFSEGAVTAPADGTVIGMSFYLSNSGSAPQAS